MSTTSLRIRVEDNEDLIAARKAAEATGVSLQEVPAEPAGDLDEHVAPIVAVLIGAAVVAGAQMVMDWWERRKGGLVIDMRPDVPDMFYRDRDVPYHFIVTRPADGGKVTMDFRDSPAAAQKWIETLIEAAFKTVGQTADAGKALLDAAKVVVA